MQYQFTNEQKEFIRSMILYCIRKCEGIKVKTGDRSIFVHILRNCLVDYAKGLINDTDIGVIPIRINEILITVYEKEVAIIRLKSDKGNSYIDKNDIEYTIQWKI